MKEGLPKGWVRAVLREVTIPVSSVDPATQPTSEFAYIDISAINNQTFTIGEMKHFQGSEAPSRARRPVQQDDILFSNVRTYLRNIAHVDFPCARTLCSTGFTVLRPNPAIEPKFLFRFVLSDEFIDGVTPTQTGTHYPATSDAAVLSQEIALPPLPEQCRIVAKLEALLAKVDASRKRLERIPVILKRFRQAVLAAACDGRLTEDWREANAKPGTESWATKQMRELFLVRTGGTPSRKEKQYYAGGTIPWVKTGEVQNGPITSASEFITPVAVSESNAKIFPAGTILIALYGDGKTRGQVGRLTFPAATNQACAALLSDSLSEITFQYVFCFWLSQYQRLRDESAGGNQQNLNLGIIKDWVISLPPEDEQAEIVCRTKDLLALADQIEARYAKAKVQVDRLAQSILAKAFRGELVPQNPNDEPADVLLSRLGAATTEASAPARRRGRPPRVQPTAPPVAIATPAEDREAPALANLTPEAILQAHREVLASIPSPLSEDNLLRAVALRLGFQRLGSRIRGRISQALTHGDQPA